MSLLDEFIDIGAKAMLAAMRGDEEEYKRLVEKGRSIKTEMDLLHINKQEFVNFFEDTNIKKKSLIRNRLKKIVNPKVTTSLGDVFKTAMIEKEQKR
jgi:hypothetical protein